MGALNEELPEKAVQWMVGLCPGKRSALDKDDAVNRRVNEN
jgi:IS5 family transposase